VNQYFSVEGLLQRPRMENGVVPSDASLGTTPFTVRMKTILAGPGS